MHIKDFINYFIVVSFNTQKGAILRNFCNPKIPGLGRRQSRNLGLV